MISTVAFLLFLGLIVFGPKKTLEFAQEIGRHLAQLKHAAAQFQHAALASDQRPEATGPLNSGTNLSAPPLGRSVPLIKQ